MVPPILWQYANNYFNSKKTQILQGHQVVTKFIITKQSFLSLEKTIFLKSCEFDATRSLVDFGISSLHYTMSVGHLIGRFE